MIKQDPPELVSQTPLLELLTPEYRDKDHQVYLTPLQTALSDANVRNVALTGRYGIGKSSVLSELQRQDQSGSDSPTRIISLSMSSLASTAVDLRHRNTPEPGMLTDSEHDGDACENCGDVSSHADDPTNIIQKEIVKQLLYREPAHKMRGSHFHRIEPFRMRETLGLSVLIGLLIAIVVGLSGLLSNAADVFGIPLEQRWVPTVAVMAVIGLLFSVGGFGVLKAMHNRLRIDQASVGSATVRLSKGIDTYFDEYLDEIVYFFTQTSVRTVIFEDLDRFRDPRIFETLRELNNVLNSVQDLKDGPVRFIYALRDGIFDEELTVPTSERQIVAAHDRVKFFDVIIPMVPFISPKVSHDVIRGEVDTLPEVQRPSIKVLNIVTPFLVDMRLIKNIRNEYAVFASQLLRLDLALTKDRLFAMVVYKNLRMSDFDRIGDGSSRLDTIYQAYRKLVNDQVPALGKRAGDLQSQIDQIDNQEPRAKELGARLREVLSALQMPHDARSNLDCLPRPVPMSEINTPTFWANVIGGEIKLRFARSQGGSMSQIYLEPTNLGLLMGLPFDDWKRDSKAILEADLKNARRLQDFVRSASIADLLSKQDVKAVLRTGEPTENLTENLTECINRVCDSDGLTMQLFQHGLIDENYALYATRYQGRLSLSAMNFVLHSVQPNRSDPNYQFAKPSNDIPAVAASEGSRFFDGLSFLNYQVFDYYAQKCPSVLAAPVERLLSSKTDIIRFLPDCLYFRDNTLHHETLKPVVPFWPNAFDFLLTGIPTLQDPKDHADPVTSAISDSLIIAATERGPDFYQLGKKALATLDHYAPHLRCLTQPIEPTVAAKLANLFAEWGLRLSNLDTAAEPQLSAIVERSLYKITYPNLALAAGPGSSTSIDELAASKPQVYQYMLHNMDQYLSALDSAQTEPPEEMHTISTSVGLIKVLPDLLATDADAVDSLIDRAAPWCVTDLTELDSSVWPVLARTCRFQASYTNLAAYISTYGGIDTNLASLLRGAEEIADVGEVADGNRATLAAALLSCPELDQNRRIDLAKSLAIMGQLEPESVTDEAIIPSLVGDLIDDGPMVYSRLVDSSLGTKTDLIRHSANLTSYLPLLCLSEQDLETLVSAAEVSEKVYEAILANLSSEEAIDPTRVSPRVGTLLTARLIDHTEAVSPTTFENLASSKADGIQLMQLLANSSSDWAAEDLRMSVSALPAPYCDIVPSKGTDERIEVKECAGLRKVLERLRQVSLITGFRSSVRGKVRMYRIY